MKQFVAMKALIVSEGKVLVLRESSSYNEGSNEGKYDLPGGRLKLGESWKDALHREVKEETGLEIDIEGPMLVDEWRPTVKGEEWHIIGVYFLCTPMAGEIQLSEDHDEYKLIDPGNYTENMLPSVAKALARLKELQE